MSKRIDQAALPPVVTVDELAALLRVNRKTIYESISRNEIPGIQRIGRQFRASRDVVLAWLANGAEAGAVAARGCRS